MKTAADYLQRPRYDTRNIYQVRRSLNTINLCHKHKASWAAVAGLNLNWNHIYPRHNHHSPCILLSIMAIGPVRSTIHYNSSDVGMFLFESPFTHQSLAATTIRICWLIKKVRSHQDRVQGVPKMSRFANYNYTFHQVIVLNFLYFCTFLMPLIQNTFRIIPCPDCSECLVYNIHQAVLAWPHPPMMSVSHPQQQTAVSSLF